MSSDFSVRPDYALAAIRISDNVFFGVGRLVMDLVILLVVPAIPLIANETSLTVSVLSAGVGVVAAWRDLTRLRLELEDPDEIRVFQAVAEGMWVLEQPYPSGKRVPVRRGILDDDLDPALAPRLDHARVAAVLNRLRDRGVLERTDGARWRVVF